MKGGGGGIQNLLRAEQNNKRIREQYVRIVLFVDRDEKRNEVER